MAYSKRDCWWNSNAVIDTLRLSVDDYTAIVAELSGDSDQQPQIESRRSARLQLWRRRCVMRLEHGDASRPPYNVLPNNISAGGASILHGFFVQTGTACHLAVEALDGSMQVAGGTIVRCRHLSSKVHELGIAFTERPDLNALIPNYKVIADAEGDADKPRFTGHVLYVDDCDEDRDMFDFLAAELGASTRSAGTIDEALAAAGTQRFDLVLGKLRLADGGATGLTERLRKAGYCGVIQAVSCAAPPITQEESTLQQRALQNGCNGIVHTPLTRERLIDVFTGILPRAQGATPVLEPIYSTYWANAKMRPLITKFVSILDARVRQLEKLLSAQQLEEFHHTCQQLSASSDTYGYAQIARQLSELDSLVAANNPLDSVQARLNELNRLCAAAKMIKK